MNPSLGKPLSRIDGKLKVTGGAQFSADFSAPGLLHGVLFQSTIAAGTVKKIHESRARQVKGVVEIITHENALKMGQGKGQAGGSTGEAVPPLQSSSVRYNGQYLGVVLAETLEAAQEAARIIEIEYEESDAITDFESERKVNSEHLKKDPNVGEVSLHQGDAKAKLAESTHRMSAEYRMPMEHHNPMEPHATLAELKNAKLILHEATQGVSNTKKVIAQGFQHEIETVQVITKFIGGGFGCKGAVWPHSLIAGMAAIKLKRPVKLVLTRPQMFFGTGYRAQTIQNIELGTNAEGNLLAIQHSTVNPTAVDKKYPETCTALSKLLYQSESFALDQYIVSMNQNVPTFMRAPGESSGSFAIESAMDEMASILSMDPIEFRLKNYAEKDPTQKIPFSSKSLKECYEKGASQFGWSARKSQPRSLKKGDYWVGYGMATASYPVHFFPAKAKVVIYAEGRAEITSATQDIGTGTYTALAQLSADALHLPQEKIHFDLGDSDYPEAGVSGGSSTISSVGWAIHEAANAALDEIGKLAIKDPLSPFQGLALEDLKYANGQICSRTRDSLSEDFFTVLKRNGKASVSGDGEMNDKKQKLHEKNYSSHSFGAQFAEVHVHALTGEVRVSRMTGAFAAGHIVNPKTARSQFMGGMIFGIGAALMEHSQIDARNGRQMVKDLADYHVPVNRDVPDLEIIMIDEVDTIVNPAGTKGIGEIGIVGAAASIANAIYNATGIRVRDLPITPEKIALSLH